MGALFGKPESDPVKVMPSVDDKAVKDAKRKRMASGQRRSGVASTNLSRGTGRETTLGG